MELHHSSEQEASEKVTKLFINKPLAVFARLPNGGLMLTSSTFARLRHGLLADLAIRYRLPSISAQPGFVKEGGLMEYGNEVSLLDQYRKAAGYVDRILKGTKPSDLPVQGADRYTFVINLKTAKALGLQPPLSLLGLADEVIE